MSTNALEDALKQLPVLFKEREEQLKKREEEFQLVKDSFEKEYPERGKSDDVLHLDVGGTPVNVLRRTLTQAEGSMLASKFSGRWDDNIEKTKDGRFFIDQPVELFLPLIDYLRALATHHPNVRPPKPPTFQGEQIMDFRRLVEYYGLSQVVYPLGIYLIDKKGATSHLVESKSEARIECEEFTTYCLAPLDKLHRLYIKSFEVKVGNASAIQVGWMSLGRSALLAARGDGTQGVGYGTYSMAWDGARSGMATWCDDTAGEFKSVPNTFATEGTTIRCEKKGESWYVDGNLVASTKRKDDVATVSSTLKGTPAVPCVSIVGSFEFQNLVYEYE